MKTSIPCTLFNFIHKPQNLQTQQLVVKFYFVNSKDKIIEILLLEQQSENKFCNSEALYEPIDFSLALGFKELQA